MAQNLKNCSKGSFTLAHESNPTLEEARAFCETRKSDNKEIVDRDTWEILEGEKLVSIYESH